MARIMRKYTFEDGKKAWAGEMNEELDQLTAAHNDSSDRLDEIDSELPSSEGASKIGTESGGTVQSDLDALAANKVDRAEGERLITEAEAADIVLNTAGRHSHSNKSILDEITSAVKEGYDRLVSLFRNITSVSNTITDDATKLPTSKAVVDYVVYMGGGDMTKAVYDPQNKRRNIFAVFTTLIDGLVPKSVETVGKFLRDDGNWADVPMISDARDVSLSEETAAVYGLAGNDANVDMALVVSVSESVTVNVSTYDSESVLGRKVTLHNLTTPAASETITLVDTATVVFRVRTGSNYYVSVNNKPGYDAIPPTAVKTASAGSASEINLVYTQAVYGVEWDKTLDTYLRLGDAEGLSVGPNTPGVAIPSDFDNAFPWSEIKRCNLADDLTVNAFLGGAGYTEDGSNGQVMVEVPKFYYKTEFDGDKRRWWVSKWPKAGFKVERAFIRDGVEIDYLYPSAYEGNVASSVMRSIAGVQPSTSTNVTGKRSDFQAYATSRGTGWFNWDVLTWFALQRLFVIEFADLNAQRAIGRGVVDEASGSANHSHNTGLAAAIGNGSGRQAGTDGKTSVVYRGVENPWGNTWTWLSGLNIQGNHKAYIADHGYVDDKFNDHYEYVGDVPSTHDSYIKDFLYSEEFDYGFLPAVVGGSENTFVGDNYWVATGNRVASCGAYWGHAGKAGWFALDLRDAASDSYRYNGGRLVAYKREEV